MSSNHNKIVWSLLKKEREIILECPIGLSVNTRVFIRGRQKSKNQNRLEDVIPLALKIEEEARSRGMQAASRIL